MVLVSPCWYFDRPRPLSGLSSALGKLHRPHDICAERFKEELHFWRLSSLEVHHTVDGLLLKLLQFAPCCSYFNDLPRVTDSSEYDKEFEGVGVNLRRDVLRSFRLAAKRYARLCGE